MSPSAEPCQRQVGKRRWFRRVVGLLFASPLILLLGTNAWLHSPWGCRWVAAKVSQRVHLPCRINSISWLPGGAVWIKGLVIAQPPALAEHCEAPVLSVNEITIRPAWSQLLRGRYELLSLSLNKPQVCLTAEMVVELARRNQPPVVAMLAPAALPAVGAVAAPVAAPIPPLEPTQPAETPTAAVANPPPALPAIAEKDTAWLTIEDGSCTLYHASSKKNLAIIGSITAQIPIAGSPAEGQLRMANIRFLDHESTDIQLKLTWNQPFLSLPQQNFTLFGWNMMGGVQIAHLPGMPFVCGIMQKNEHWRSPQHEVQAEQIESIHHLQGLLSQPVTWAAESRVQAQNLDLHWQGHNSTFFTASSRCVLQRGILQCTDARILGDDFSLLANGLFFADGRLSTQTRLISARRSTAALTDKFQTVFPESRLIMAPFPNEDRSAIDLLCGGNFQQPWVSFDQGKNLLDLHKLLSIWQQHTATTAP